MVRGQYDDSKWHLDKRIPITLIVTMVIQTVAIGIWVGTLQARLNYVEGAVTSRADDISRLAVVESKLVGLDRTLQEIKAEIRELAKR